jgi:metal-responsive CopG/Arc/MetJ family transcriptional regulator
VRINIWLDDDTLKLIDEHCQVQGFSRSGFIKKLALKEIKSIDKPQSTPEEKPKEVTIVCKHGNPKFLCRLCILGK